MSHPLVGWRTSDQDDWGLRSNLMGHGIFEDFHAGSKGNLYSKIAIPREMAATAFFKQAINNNGFPHKVVMDKSGTNYAGIENINMLLMLAGLISFIEICQVKYLNNVIDQDHRFIKKIRIP